MRVHKIPLNNRVRLKGDRTGAYSLARAGAEGWIRAHTVDPVGFYSMVLVEWDKEHWTYNGQEDMWTYEDHFEPIGELTIMNKKPDREALAQALSVIQGALTDDDESEQHDVEFVEAEEQATTQAYRPRIGPIGEGRGEDKPMPAEHYKEVLRRAVEHAAEGDAFVVVSVRQEPNPFQNGRMAMIPRIFKAEKTEEAATLCGAQLGNLARDLYAELAVERIEEILTKKGEGPQAA